MMTNRTYQLGRLKELEDEIRSLEFRIDSEVQTLQDQFQPKTRDLSYIKDIDPERIKTYAKDIARDREKHRKLLTELESLKKELGEE